MKPQSRLDLFLSFSILALQGFGGVLAIVQRELVEKKRWLTQEEFLEDWAVAQILPGPNVVNISLMIGDRHYGLSGALCALAGMVVFPLIIVLFLAYALSGYTELPALQNALRGMSAVTAGLIAATGIKLVAALQSNALGMTACWILAGITFVAIAVFHIPLAAVLLLLGSISTFWAYRQLGLKERGAKAP